MERIEKFRKLCGWLNNTNHTWYEPIPSPDMEWMPKGVRLITDEKRIAVCVVEPEREAECFKALREHNYRPLFIREEDSANFVIEKMSNCLKGWNTATVKEMQARKPKRKRARVRIHHEPTYEKIEPKHKAK